MDKKITKTMSLTCPYCGGNQVPCFFTEMLSLSGNLNATRYQCEKQHAEQKRDSHSY